MNDLKSAAAGEHHQTVSFRKEEAEQTTEIEIRKIENGYITVTRMWGDVDGEWKDYKKEVYSKEDPTKSEGKSKEEGGNETLIAIKGLMNSLGNM